MRSGRLRLSNRPLSTQFVTDLPSLRCARSGHSANDPIADGPQTPAQHSDAQDWKSHSSEVAIFALKKTRQQQPPGLKFAEDGTERAVQLA